MFDAVAHGAILSRRHDSCRQAPRCAPASTSASAHADCCLVFRQGHCAAGDRCHFRHDLDSASDEDEYEVVKVRSPTMKTSADDAQNACNWFQKGQCKVSFLRPGETRQQRRFAVVGLLVECDQS